MVEGLWCLNYILVFLHIDYTSLDVVCCNRVVLVAIAIAGTTLAPGNGHDARSLAKT